MRELSLLCVLVTVSVGVDNVGAQETKKHPPKVIKHTDSDPVRVQTYRVRAGDSMYSIAKQLLGKAAAVNDIGAANPGLDPRRLRVGQVIKLPAGKVAPAAAQQSDETTCALRRARRLIQAAERAADRQAARKALDEAEKALMEARRALWKEQTRQPGRAEEKQEPKKTPRKKPGLPIGTFFQVLAGPF